MNHFEKAFILYMIAGIITIITSENDHKPQQHQKQQLANDNICGNYYHYHRNRTHRQHHQNETAFLCDIPNQSDKGFCIVTSKCRAYQKIQNQFLIDGNLTLERIHFLKSVQCGNNVKIGGDSVDSDRGGGGRDGGDSIIKVCCPQNCTDYVKPEINEIIPFNKTDALRLDRMKRDIKTTAIPINLKSDCGKQISNRIYGGEIAELNEFPWMALIIYNSHEYGCGGVLISRRHVLTAAHCVKGPIVREMKGLKLIRLGEFNTKTQPDCIEERNYVNCADISRDMSIDKVIVYPSYNEHAKSKPDDIAIIQLRNYVQITQFIMPICLPDKNDENPIVPGRMFSVSGWGRTDLFKRHFPNIRSPIKLKLRVPIVSHEDCSNILKPFGFELSPTQICAGGEASKDTCAGDSGGPLMYFDRKNSRWVTYGIVSYGFTECGLPNHPAVYTNVLNYLDWIIKIITTD